MMRRTLLQSLLTTPTSNGKPLPTEPLGPFNTEPAATTAHVLPLSTGNAAAHPAPTWKYKSLLLAHTYSILIPIAMEVAV